MVCSKFYFAIGFLLFDEILRKFHKSWEMNGEVKRENKIIIFFNSLERLKKFYYLYSVRKKGEI